MKITQCINTIRDEVIQSIPRRVAVITLVGIAAIGLSVYLAQLMPNKVYIWVEIPFTLCISGLIAMIAFGKPRDSKPAQKIKKYKKRTFTLLSMKSTQNVSKIIDKLKPDFVHFKQPPKHVPQGYSHHGNIAWNRRIFKHQSNSPRTLTMLFQEKASGKSLEIWGISASENPIVVNPKSELSLFVEIEKLCLPLKSVTSKTQSLGAYAKKGRVELKQQIYQTNVLIEARWRSPPLTD